MIRFIIFLQLVVIIFLMTNKDQAIIYNLPPPIIKNIVQCEKPKQTVDINNRLADVENDIDYVYLRMLSFIESSNNPNAISPTGARGLYQFTSVTAKRYNLTDPMNPQLSLVAVKQLTKDNRASLIRLGIEPNYTNLYLAHQQGVTGLSRLYSDKKLSKRMRRRLDQNGGKGLDSKQFIDKWNKKVTILTRKGM